MNPRSTAAVKFNFASGQNNPAFRYHPRERSDRYGTDYLRIPFTTWLASYDHPRIGLALAQAGYPVVNTTEAAILTHLQSWDAVQYTGKHANAAALGKLTHRAPQNVSKTLRRLGRSHVIVNVGGDRALNMRINGNTEGWDLSMLEKERAIDMQRVTALHQRTVEMAWEDAVSEPHLSLELRRHREMANGPKLATTKFKDLYLTRTAEQQKIDRDARLEHPNFIPCLLGALESAARKPFQGENNGFAWWCQADDAELLGLLVYWDEESGMINRLHGHPSGGRASAPAIADAIARVMPPLAPEIEAKVAAHYRTPDRRRRRHISHVQSQLAYLATRAVLVNQGERWRPDYRINWRMEEWDWNGLARDAARHYPVPSPVEKVWRAQNGAPPYPV